MRGLRRSVLICSTSNAIRADLNPTAPGIPDECHQVSSSRIAGRVQPENDNRLPAPSSSPESAAAGSYMKAVSSSSSSNVGNP